jgi:hypothetical protein
MDYLEFQMLSIFLFTQRCNIYGQDKLMEIATNQKNEVKTTIFKLQSSISDKTFTILDYEQHGSRIRKSSPRFLTGSM